MHLNIIIFFQINFVHENVNNGTVPYLLCQLSFVYYDTIHNWTEIIKIF